MKIGIFGGTFDPWTEAHASIVKEVLDRKLVDKVIVIPTVVDYYREDKERWLTDQERVAVIRRAKGFGVEELVRQGYKVELSEMEIAPSSVLTPQSWSRYAKGRRFYHTLVDVIDDNGGVDDNKYLTIIGTDQFEIFRKWFMYEDILKLSDLVVVQGRGGRIVTNGISHYEIILPSGMETVSASKIRRKYRGLSDSVKRYINGESPYGPDERLLSTPIFDVYRSGEIQPGFKPVFVKAPQWVTVIAEQGGRWLTVTQLRYGTMTDECEFVAGQVDEGEDPRHAAERELLEEAGIALGKDSIVCLGSFKSNPAFMTNRMHYFYTNLDTMSHRVCSQSLDEHERLTVKYVDKETFRKNYVENHGSIFVGTALWLYDNYMKRQ